MKHTLDIFPIQYTCNYSG